MATAIVMFIVYAVTSPHVVSHEDMAEFQTLAFTGGIAHAGYPLLVVCLGLLAHLPISTVAYRANLLSALAGALAVGLAAASAARISRSSVIGSVCALALGLCYSMWMESTRAEAHAFTLAIAGGLFLAVVAYRRRPSWPLAGLAGWLAGAGLVSHLSILGLLTPLALGAAWWWIRGRLPAGHAAAAALGLGLALASLGVLVYYDRPGHPMNYIEQTFRGIPEPGSTGWKGVSDHLTRLATLLSGRQFLAGWFYPFKDALYRMHLLTLDLLFNEYFVLGLPLALVGLGGMVRNKDAETGLLILWFVATVFWLLVGAFPMVVTSFFLPGLWILCQWMAKGVGEIRRRSPALAGVTLTLLAIAPVVRLQWPEPTGLLAAHPVAVTVWHMVPRDWNPLRPDGSWDHFGREALATVEPRAILLCCWEGGTTLRYLRLVEQVRPDVEVRLTCADSDQIEQARQEARRSGRPVYLTFDPGAAHLRARRESPVRTWSRGSLWRLD